MIGACKKMGSIITIKNQVKSVKIGESSGAYKPAALFAATTNDITSAVKAANVIKIPSRNISFII